ncbi:TPA_asm: coat protein [ssRNA phage Gephyllon.3_4]|uniref:Coat protein n=2 Tax=Fiersviridae TaxID=2842319 RepID=A0A8S5KYF3_9VIRU|nr:coat protein [ssRNA phage Gephyllon.3_4]QDH91275.1 MAG: hypothetical protein H3BulkLitter16405_000003 [Leviviridae sp.]DAD50336.1 TPA_asm: coat protein [ssRNA phage Gephyllon.3_4]
MPQIGNIVINDGSATPVAYTFSPIGKDDKNVFWFEQTIPAPVNGLGACRIGYSQTRVLDAQKQLTGNSKVVYTLNVPTLETMSNNSAGITPPPTLAYVEKARLEYSLAERSLAAERKNTRVFCLNFLGTAMAISNLDSLQPSYS